MRRYAYVLVAMLAMGETASSESTRVIWLNKPAANWQSEAFPLGNGRLGGMVFGGMHEEHIQFNVDSLWTGDQNPSGEYRTPGMGAYQNFGDLFIAFNGDKGSGAVTVPSGHSSYYKHESEAFTIDGDAKTKWCVEHKNKPVIWQISVPGDEPIAVKRYAFTSAPDTPSRDPESWVLEGSNDGENWTLLDSRDDEPLFGERSQKRVYEAAGDKKFSEFRITFMSVHGGIRLQLGEIDLGFAVPQIASESEYRRELDITSAVCRVSYRKDGVKFVRETFCSYPDQVIVARLSASEAGKYTGIIRLKDGHGVKTTLGALRMTITGKLENGLEYEAQVLVKAEGGVLKAEGESVVFTGCDALTLFLAADTSYVMDYAKRFMGSRITPPVVVGGRVFFSVPDRHSVVCLDSGNGKKLWEYTAGARIDSPPTYYRGTLLFGSADGWVYSITADRGELRWRYRCAPEDRLIGANGQLESSWPVAGSILVQDDIAYAAAGRCSMVDGGIYLYALNPVDGSVLHRTVETDPGIIDPTGGATAYYTAGVLADILVGDGRYVYLRHRKFDRALVKQPDNHVPPTGVRHVLNTGVRLYASAGFTDTHMHHRSYWAVGENFGSMMAFDSKATYGVKVYNMRRGWSPRFDPATTGCLLYEAPTAEWKGGGQPERKSFEEFFPGMNTTYTWSMSVPMTVRAMAVARNAVFVAGPPDVVDEDDPLGALENRKGGIVKAINRKDGKQASYVVLPSPPIFDGMAIAAGRLLVSCSDGSLVSMGASDD